MACARTACYTLVNKFPSCGFVVDILNNFMDFWQNTLTLVHLLATINIIVTESRIAKILNITLLYSRIVHADNCCYITL